MGAGESVELQWEMRERSCEASAIEMGEKFQRWSFKDERADGETEKEEKEENRTNERDKREILEEKGIIKYIYIYIYIYILQYWYNEFYL